VTAFQQLSYLYHHPISSAVHYREAGQNIIGYISPDVPIELIIAAGLHPLRLKGNPEAPIRYAHKYLKSNFNPFFCSIFDQILDLTYSFVDRLILSNLDESVVRLFYYLREIHRLEPNPQLPPVEYFEFLHLKTEISLQYNLQCIESFKQKLEQWLSKTIQEVDLWEAIAVGNENRKLLAELANLRRQGLVSGIDALQLIGTSMLMPKHEHNQLLQTFFQEYEATPSSNAVRIFVEGSSIDNLQLYQMIESAGAIVVAEDSDWGNRSFEGQISETGSPLEAITNFYFNRAPYPTKATIEERAEYCLNQAQKAKADAVIFFIYQGDQPALWDYPEQRNALEAHGIPSLNLPTQPYNLADNPDLNQQIRDFIQSLSVEKARQK
jgi:benzoyl-CoA reductase/2-hydroxyglutaryl-CoA dehydratase subunit BcrC/BadD/HgdB